MTNPIPILTQDLDLPSISSFFWSSTVGNIFKPRKMREDAAKGIKENVQIPRIDNVTIKLPVANINLATL